MSATEEEFAKFLCFCEKSLSGPSKQLINLVKKRYDECSDKFKGTQELYHLLSSCRKKMESDSRHLFVHLKDCLNELKAYAKGRKGEKRKHRSEYDSDDTVWKRTKTSNGEFRDKEDKNTKSRSLTSSPVPGEPSKQARDDSLQDSKLKDKQRESKLKISPNSACSSKLADIIRNLKDKKGGGDALCEDTVVSKGDSVGNGCTTNTDGDLKSEGEKKLELPESGKVERAVLDNDDDDDDCILIDDSPPHQSTDLLEAASANTDVKSANTDVNSKDDLKLSGSDSALSGVNSKPARVSKLSLSASRTSIGFRPLTPDANDADISSATNGTESTKDVVTGDQSAATDSSRSPSAADGDHSNSDQHPSVNSGNDSGSPMISKTDLDVEMISDSEKDSDLKPDMKSDCADNEEDEKPKMSSTERTSPSVETCDTHEHSPGGKDMEISIPESQESSSESTALPRTSPPAATSLNTSPINTSIPSPAAEEDAHATSATEGSPGTSGITADSAPVITGGSGEPSVLRTSKPCNLSSGDTSEHSDLPVITADSPTDVMSDHCESPSGETSEHRNRSVVITAEQRDSPTDVMSEQCDSPVVVTAEHGDLPTDVMSEDKDMSVVITEHGDSPTDVMSEQCDSPVIIAEHSDLPTDDCDVTSEHCDSPCDVTSEHCDSLRTNQTTGSTSQGSAVGRGEEKKKEEPVKKKEEPEKKRAEPEKKRAEPEKKREEPEKKRAEPEKKREEQEKKRAQPEKKKEVSEKHIHRLEKLLEKLETKIQQVQARELSLDDLAEEDSSYIYEDKLKKKFVAVWNKLCELKDRTPSTGRPTERRFNYQGTRYPEVNKKIEKMINKKKVFPDFHDMKRLVAKVSINQKLHLSQKEIESVAREAFTDVGNLLQQRRQDDYITTFGCRLTDYEDMNHDPAMYNAELKQKLEENQQKGKTNLENVIRKFSDMQYETGEEAVEVPEGSEEDERMEEEDERLDEEDASDEDVMEVNDEDLASDNEDLIKIKPRSKKRNIELVSDPEDRSPSSSLNMKHPMVQQLVLTLCPSVGRRRQRHPHIGWPNLAA